jgi:predicted nucleic acid-binding protein
MIVVADTSPLNYLILIDQIDLLPALFGHVLLPRVVFRNCCIRKLLRKYRYG